MSYGPWARVIELIFKEEVTHIRHGDMWAERLAKDPATHEDCQQTFNKWYSADHEYFWPSRQFPQQALSQVPP